MSLTSFSDSWPQSHASWKPTKESKLKLQLEAQEDIAILHCRGRISYREEAVQFSKKVAELLPLTHHLIVELSGIDLIDSAGLGELVLVLLWAQACGCSIKLAAPRRGVRETLELTNLASVFEVHSSCTEAINCWRPVA